ncbi:MAG TPA: DUF4350 domain-containing protein [Acidimicrobiales bacterium]|nr:DUF4350 domain-containing protein [Acidimicrobiales bacterium]
MIVEAWRSMRPGARAAVVAVVLVIGLNLLVEGVTVITGGSGPGGPTSSSYATADDGLAAFAELLSRRGHTVRQLRVPLDEAGLDAAWTVVVADPDGVSGEEAQALASFVGSGGRLIAAGRRAAPLVDGLLAGGMEWDAAAVPAARPLVPVAEVAGVTTVESAGAGHWSDAGPSLPVLGSGDRVLATVASTGPGRIVALADASPLQNRLLARGDNAAFALATVGEPGRPVAFAEAQHGYGRETGLGAVPSRWRRAVAGGFVAAVVWMWSRARRLGPPDEVERDQAPPRRAYVEAMAAALARTRQPDLVVAGLQERARRRLAERAGARPDASDDDLRRAAGEAGLAPDEVDALFRPARTDADVVAVGRAAAHLAEGPR